MVLLVVASSAGCGGGDTMRTNWWLAAEPVGDRLEVVAYTNGSSCTDFDRIDVDETAEEVVVRAYVDHRDGDCTGDYSTHSVTVELDAPLGDRRMRGCAAPEDGLRAPDRRVDPNRCADPDSP